MEEVGTSQHNIQVESESNEIPGGGKRLLALPTLLAKVLSAGCFSTYPQKARRKMDVVCVGNFINAWTGEIS
jgi:hypothetical protein